MGPGTTHSTASAAVDAVLCAISRLAQRGDKFTIMRFGSFSLSPTGKLRFRPSRSFPDKPV